MMAIRCRIKKTVLTTVVHALYVHDVGYWYMRLMFILFPPSVKLYEAINKINKQFGTKINLTEGIRFSLS